MSTTDDLDVKRRSGGRSRVSSLLQRLSWCGCSSDSRIPSRPKSPALSDCTWRSALIVEPEDCVDEPDDVAKHFDLSSIKFIDEDDDDQDAVVSMASSCRSYSWDEVLDGPNVRGIEDAWVIAVERGARERLQRLTALRRIHPRDIQAILHQQITEGGAPSTSEESAEKDAPSSEITVTLSDKESVQTNAYPPKLSNGTIPKGIDSQEQHTALEKQQSCPEEQDLPLGLQVGGVRASERRASSPFQNGRTEVLIGEPEGGPRSPRGSTSPAVNDAAVAAGGFLNQSDEPILRSRTRNGSGVPGIPQQQHQQQQQEVNNVAQKESAGPDQMWAPGSHHRELPVDVPDHLLQQAYPNKVIQRDLALNAKRSSAAAALVASQQAETTCRLPQSAEPQSPPNPQSSRPLSASQITLDFSKDSDRIELSIKEPELLISDVDVIDVDVDDVEEPIGKLIIEDIRIDTKDPFRTSDDEEEHLSGHKESSVDADEDYPFAKEDYPTMLKTCSDDSASPRSSSGRSDSTVPLDSSLVLRSSDLVKDSTMSRNSKLFGKTNINNTSTSFDNPAYGLEDFQDIQNLMIRSEQVNDLTLLIGEQTLNKVNGQMNNNKSSLLDTDKMNLKYSKKEKRQIAKISSPEAEELLRIGSTDELLSVELSSIPRIRKKKQHSSSGYSTLRSDASADFDQVDNAPFLVVGRKHYREVAVDCPPDFIPVTKCHPVYPPPSRTSSKSNTLDAKRVDSKSSKKTENNNEVETLDDIDAAAVRRSADGKKVRSRSKVRSLLIDGLKVFDHHQHRPLNAYCTNNPSTQHKRFSTNRTTAHASPAKQPKSLGESINETLSKSFAFGPKANSKPSKSRENLVDEDDDGFGYHFLGFDNPCLDISAQIHDEEIYEDVVCTFTTFLGDSSCNVADNDDAADPDLDFEKPPVRIEIEPDCSQFIQEKNQNSRNSLREVRVYYSPRKIEDDTFQSLEDSPNTQNKNNSRLSLVYRQSKRFEINKDLEAKRVLSKSELDLSNSSVTAMNGSFSKMQNWLSDTQIASSTLPLSDEKVSVEKTEEVQPKEDSDEQAGLNGVKPAIPPRDQKRAPARPPKDNLRLSAQNNNVEELGAELPPCSTPQQPVKQEPTQQQLRSIQKYQEELRKRKDEEELRKRKDEEERQEYLNRSLRGSRKLQALESHATSLSGQENLAYAQDEVTTAAAKPSTPAHGSDVEEPPRPLTYGEVVATLERLQLHLRNISGTLGISGPGLEAELEAVKTLLVQKRFATALSTHHELKARLRYGKSLKLHTDDASSLARDVVEVLEQWTQTAAAAGSGTSGETIAAAEELTGLLTSYEMEGLLLAHDSAVRYVDGLQRKHSGASSPGGAGGAPPSPTASSRDSRLADNIKIIRIEKTNEPLGATVRNENDAVIIGRVVRGGAADKSGLLHEGDEVLEVNGVEMRGKSVNEVCDILAGMQGSLTFLILPAPTTQRNNRREDAQQIHHVRAHFDYDPEEDPYIPCRELGVGFQKGDVLHVISQEDPNWWQAYREGEEDQALAGLIPSRAFQHQRESMKQSIAGEKSTIRGSKKSSTLLCARKNPKKKKRSKFGSNFNDDGYPLYATTSIDDYDSEEVLTYEEVALYYPRADHKRPIVLIGPPNIGRHELRQRLMQDSEKFAAAIPHTSRPRKDTEVDGQDYHFISRQQFESDILCRKFVEHGEYEKAYYGTSVEAIRTVVNSGKICVLNLHPQSLKILRNSDLKPYVVFVAPPSLEKLKQKRIKNNEAFKEEELKDIIEKAREMEDKYGHLFDMIIINNDTDRAYNQLLTEINSLEREPQWVPATWVQ